MRKLILYEEKQLNILVSQIELEYHKTIIYHLCEACRDPVLINDFHSYSDQCKTCKKWFCTKKYIHLDQYFESCSHKYLTGLYEQNDSESSGNDSNNVELVCTNCITKIINKSNKNQFCEHILDSVIHKSKISDSIIVNSKDNNKKKYLCEECDAINHLVIYI